MRATYSSLLSTHFRYIGNPTQTADATLLADFQYSLGNRYQMVMGTLSSYINQDTLTASTVAAQQYYYNPVGTVGIDSASITIGSVQYTLTPIYDQYIWNMLNAMQIQPTAIPQFIFPRKDDFGIWPIPQAVYTINFQRFFRDRNMLVADYTTGLVVATSGSAIITGSGGATFTPAMVGRWFTITDTTIPGRGYWARIGGYTNGTTLTLETDWWAATTVASTYIIGESPEMPEEGHSMLPYGTAADFYAGLRSDTTKAAYFDNMFWSGSGANSSRDLNDKNITSGLIGLLRKYKDRERSVIVQREPRILPPAYKIFAQSLS